MFPLFGQQVSPPLHAPLWVPQLQVPVRHALVPPEQPFPHPPQLLMLLEVSTQAPPQQVWLPVHAAPVPHLQPLLQLSALFRSQMFAAAHPRQ